MVIVVCTYDIYPPSPNHIDKDIFYFKNVNFIHSSNSNFYMNDEIQSLKIKITYVGYYL